MENIESEEIWKEIEINGYFVSNTGKIKGRSGKELKQQTNHNGYLVVCLQPNGRKGGYKGLRVHILVAKAFLPNPENKPQVNHIDGNKSNNNVKNLEWCTNQENVIHAYKMGLCKIKRGEDNYWSKLTNEQAEWIRKHYIPRDKQFGSRALGRKFNISHQQILDIVNNKSYKNVK